MPSCKEQVYILTMIPYRDSDLIVKLLSHENGKLSAVIYGGRKIGKPSSFHFHPGDLIDIEYQKNENREFVKVVNVSGTQHSNTDRFPYDRFVFHSYLIELIARFSKPELPADEFFDILSENTKFNWAHLSRVSFMAWSIWKIVKAGGYQFDISACSDCHRNTWQIKGDGNPAFRKQTYSLQLETGVIVCESCLGNQVLSNRLTPPMLKIIWLFETSNYYEDSFDQLPLDNTIPLIKTLNDYLLNRFEITPKSLDVFEDLCSSFQNQSG